MLIFSLFILGLISGSFVNAWVWRLEHGESVARGRSKCPNCAHTLSPQELIPIISWLALRGRCLHCKAPISPQYPLVEAGMSIVFVLSYIYWPETLSLSGQWLIFSTWLISSVGLMALAVYDLRYMLLPNKIIYPTLVVGVAGRGSYTVVFSNRPLHALAMWAASIVIASGLFWLIFEISKGKWIGFGDVRLGLITGTILASPSLAWSMLFFGSLLGTLFALPGLMRSHKSLSHKLPFGPFLIAATMFVLLFGQPIIDWYKHLIGA